MVEENEEQFIYEGLEKTLIEKNEVIKEFTFALDLFSKEVDHKKPSDHRSYVYALCEKVGDNLIPFYIGEGKGPRVWSHEFKEKEQIKLLEEELTKEGRLEELEDKKRDLTEKIQKINEIRERKGEVVKYIIKWGMTSKEAFMAESALINLLQIGGLKFECKENKLTNIVKGHQSEGEKQTGLTTARTVEEFCEEFAKEPLYFEELQEKKVKAILININTGYSEFKNDEKIEREKAIKDTACGNWRLRTIEELDKLGIEYVFATVQARVVGIYKIKKVGGKKFHYSYESAYKNSEYPHGEGTVSFRNGDYEFAKMVVDAANSKGKDPSEVLLNDMPYEYKKEIKEKVENENKKSKSKKKNANDEFRNFLRRIYMILENISEDDPNYNEYKEYLHRRIIHTKKWVENTKIKKQNERDKALKKGKTKNLPNPDNVTENIYGSGNPIKYIEE